MKILVLPSWYPYPSNPVNGTFFRDHAEALAEAGHEVFVAAAEIISLRQFSKVRKDLGMRVRIQKGVKTYQHLLINQHPKHQKAFYRHYQKVLKKLLEHVFEKEGRPDIIHVHSSLWAGAALASFNLDIPFLVSEHLKEFLMYQGFSDFQKGLINSCYQQAAAVISPSTAVEKRIHQYFKLPKNCRSYVVGNMVDTEFFKPAKEKPFVNRFTFLIVAMLRPEKRIDRIIESFISPGNTHLAKIRIVGDGPEYHHLLETVRSCSLTRQVEFIRDTGRDVVLKNLQKADVCMLYSAMETFGVSLVEALSCGVPVIAGNVGGANDFVNDSNGILVPVDNHIALQEAMRKMIEHPEQYDRKKIREDIIKRYDKGVIIQKLENIYAEVIR